MMIKGSKMAKKRKRVCVGLSGGVDSSVAAALLLQAGYDVIGVFIRGWEPPEEVVGRVCTWREDRREAMRVASLLGIPFFTLDLSCQYKQEVVDNMIAEYRSGRTPNPDVLCNQKIKFGHFLNWSREVEADLLATGHYAEIKDGKLYRGVDSGKDQSYWLWAIDQSVLNNLIFPLGELTKGQVRDLARKYNLPTAGKPDSQGLCFLGKINVRDFLAHYIDIEPGQVKDESGQVIGHHQGVSFYTIGQRHGFRLNRADGPWYVIKKDISNNVLIVSQNFKDHKEGCDQVYLKDLNWFEMPDPEKIYGAQVRYRSVPRLGKWDPLSGSFIFNFKQPDVTYGQSLVVYDGDRVIGGGIMDEK